MHLFSGPYSGNYSKDDLIPDPRCEVNGEYLVEAGVDFYMGIVSILLMMKRIISFIHLYTGK